MASTYDELVTEVTAWVRNDAAATQVPNFIAQTHQELCAKLRGLRNLETALATVDAVSSEVPADFQELHSLRLTNGTRNTPLVPVSTARLTELKAASSLTGEPEVFCIQGNGIFFYPVPAQAYEAELVYSARPPALSADNQTNWVLDEFPSVYLNGALSRGYAFLKNPEMAQMYWTLFLGGIADIRSTARVVRSPKLRTDFPLDGPYNPDLTRA